MAGYLFDRGLTVLRNGYEPIPIKPGTKAPDIRDWPNIVITEAVVKGWMQNGRADYGIGIRTKFTPCADIDCRDPAMALEMEKYFRTHVGLGFAPMRIGMPPKRALVYRTVEPFPKVSSGVWLDKNGLDNKVEILGDGEQLVIFAIHPEKRAPYDWGDYRNSPEFLKAADLEILTKADAEDAVAYFERCCKERGWKVKVRAATHQAADNDEQRGPQEPPDWERYGERIQSALNAIPIEARKDHDLWLHCLGALKYESEGSAEGKALANDWSSPAENYNKEKTVDYTWDSLKRETGKLKTRRTIFRYAIDLGDWKPPKETDTIELRHGGTYTMQKIEWLWPGWLARGKFHIVGGLKGAGKSTLVFTLAAALTSKGEWPDGSKAPLGNVLIWSAEDDIEDTILPRIVVAGGNRNLVHFVDRVIVDGAKRRFDPATDIPLLLNRLQRLPQLRMVIIDPIVSASAADSHKNAETRRGLQPVVDLAEERNIALIGVTHFTKNTQGRNPIERVTGSLAFGALPRVVMGAAKGANEDAPRLFFRIASNIGKSGGGFEYLLRQELVPEHDFTAQRVEWGKQLAGDATELLANIEAPQSEKLNAIVFLQNTLALAGESGVPVRDLQEAAKAHGFSWRTIERAKQSMQDRINVDQISGGPAHAGWKWVLADGFDP